MMRLGSARTVELDGTLVFSGFFGQPRIEQLGVWRSA